MISSKVHGAIDYVVGTLLIVAPYSLDFANGGPEQWVPMILGAGTIVYSLVTRYELSVVKLIPYKAHLAIDAVAGLLLLVSPWLFDFTTETSWPHTMVGLAELGVVILSMGKRGKADRA